MKSKVWDDLDLNALPFIDKEIGPESFKEQYLCTWDPGHDVTHQLKDEQRNIDEAINQVQACICALEYSATRTARKEAKEVLRIIRANLNWEKYDELKNKVIKLQSLLFKAG
ncbi:TPA: hypothetical protein NJU08_001251 [Acinetobacter baumannii]|uniref:hypothetical protein n=1 Tax=Acinetobacter baumannii TaxID=470 RepID=UPI000B43A38C|nr:hypothetical protein [Acinetobacter baumannii]OTN19836.1 hypothetical protein B9Y16_12585 [Acinetobacter baumannii]HCG3323632.1 hypothetical protein [Acinetobacter baumannii]